MRFLTVFLTMTLFATPALAHGVEMPASVSAIGYGTGLLTATLLLGGPGLAAGVLVDRLGAQSGPKFARAGGAVLAATG